MRRYLILKLISFYAPGGMNLLLLRLNGGEDSLSWKESGAIFERMEKKLLLSYRRRFKEKRNSAGPIYAKILEELKTARIDGLVKAGRRGNISRKNWRRRRMKDKETIFSGNETYW